MSVQEITKSENQILKEFDNIAIAGYFNIDTTSKKNARNIFLILPYHWLKYYGKYKNIPQIYLVSIFN